MSRKMFERICAICKDSKQITKQPRPGTLCPSCRSKKKRRKPIVYKIYWHFCPTCPSVRGLKTARRTQYCADCSRIESAKKRVGKKRKSPERKDMQVFYRICPDCPADDNTSVVSAARYSGIRPCKVHRKRVVPKKYNVKPRSTVLNRTTNVSPEAIEKERQKNREHKEALKQERVKPKAQKKTDEQMLEEFLKTNQPSSTFSDEPMGHFTSGMHLDTSAYY